MKVRTRIAPSPTGYPHIGTIYQMILDRAFATKHAGNFVIRIEDTDQSRLVEDAEDKLYEAVDWFGLTEDEGVRKGGKFGPYKQSERLDIYKEYVEKLIEQGNAYYCFCSAERLTEVRKEMQKAGKPPMYDGHCRELKADEAKRRIENGESYVVRLKVPRNQKIVVKDVIRGDIEFNSNVVDDQVLIKSDGFPTYHFAVVVDDHLMKITHAVRGEEWIPSAPKHVLIYQMLGWNQPVWVHTPTLRNKNKSKLSKRQGHTNVSWYQEQGFLPEAVVNFLSQLGWTHPGEKEIFTQEEFVKLFDFSDLAAAGPVFDEEKLRWMNGKYIREVLNEDDLLGRISKYIANYESEDLKFKIEDLGSDVLLKLLPLIKDRMEVLSDVYELIKFMEPELTIDTDLVLKQNKQGQEETEKLISELKVKISNLEDWTVENIEMMIRQTKGEFPEWKPRDYFMTLRVAMTGYPVTPPLFESVEVLGKIEVLNRLKQIV